MKKSIFLKIIFYCMVVLVVFIFLSPILHMFLSSFKAADEIISDRPSLIPRRWVLDNYYLLNLLAPIFSYMRNSIVVALLVSLFTVAFSTYTAYLLTRVKIRGLTFFSKVILLFYALPDIILGIGYYLVFSRIGLLDNYVGLTIAQSSLAIPFSIWMLWSYFRQIPIELDEAAKIDGASRLQTLRTIIFPLALPGITAAAIFGFITSWNEYTLAAMLMSSENLKTLPVAMALQYKSEGAFWGLIMASATISTIPIFVFVFFMIRPLIQALTAGALKR